MLDSRQKRLSPPVKCAPSTSFVPPDRKTERQKDSDEGDMTGLTGLTGLMELTGVAGVMGVTGVVGAVSSRSFDLLNSMIHRSR